jgi:hypothetical protein
MALRSTNKAIVDALNDYLGSVIAEAEALDEQHRRFPLVTAPSAPNSARRVGDSAR